MSNAITLIEEKNEALIDSLLLAEHLGITHEAILKTINKHSEILKSHGQLRFEIGVVSKKGAGQTQRLTSAYLAANLSTPCNSKAGICNPHKGHNRPLSTVVFLYPHQTPAALCRLFSVMAGCIGQPLKRLAGSFAGIANLIQSATQRFATMGGGYSLYKGVTA